MFDTGKFIYAVKIRPMLYNPNASGYHNKEVKHAKWKEIAAFMYSDWNLLSEDNQNDKLRELSVKWRSIRDYFVRRLKHMKTGKGKRREKYIYHDDLKFLLPNLEPKDSFETLWMNVTSETECVEEVSLDNIPTTSNIEVDVDVDVDDDEEEAGSNGGGAYVEGTYDTNGSVTDNNFNGGGNDCFVADEGSHVVLDNIIQSPDDSCLPPQVQLTEMNDQLGNEAFLMSLLPLLNKLPFESIMEVRIEMMQTLQRYASISRPNNQ